MGYAIEDMEIPYSVRDRLQRFFSRGDISGKSVMIYSAGLLTQRVLEKRIIDPERITAILDRNPDLLTKTIQGIEILHPDDIEKHRPHFIIILSIRYHDSIYLQMHPKCEKLGITLVDACGNHPRYERFPSISISDFPEGTLIVSDFLPSDNVRAFKTPAAVRSVYPTATEVLVCFESDQALAETTQTLIELGIKYRGYGNAHGTSWDASPRFDAPQGFCPNVMFKDDTIRSAILESRSHCAKWDICHHFDVRDFGNLLQFIRETKGLEGHYVEIGVYRGTSAVVAATYMKMTDDSRDIWLLDTYEGFCYAAAKESFDSVWAGTHFDTSDDFVSRVVNETGRSVRIRKINIVEEDLPAEINGISMVNIDVDLYEAVGAALRKVAPLVVPGGIIVCEDYGHTPGVAGAHLAAFEFLAAEKHNYINLYFESGQLCLIKRQP